MLCEQTIIIERKREQMFISNNDDARAVSYTHLDVYKRQLNIRETYVENFTDKIRYDVINSFLTVVHLERYLMVTTAKKLTIKTLEF